MVMAFWWINSSSTVEFPASVEKWRPLVSKYANGIPTDFVLAWMAHESSGRQNVTSKLGERGLFQIHPEGEREQLKLGDAEWDKVLTDPDTGIKTGIRLILMYSNRAAKLLDQHGIDWDSKSFWSLTKLHHAATAMPKYALAAFIKINGRSPGSFESLAKWALSAPKGSLADDPTFSSKLASLAKKVFPNSSKVGGVVP